MNFTLVAVWACAAKNKRESYVGQIRRALEAQPAWLRRSPVVLAGDFNSSAIFDKGRPDWNHSSMVRRFRRKGLVSAYHSLYGEKHGVETMPTFHLYRRAEERYRYHFDYIFLPETWRIESVSVGQYCEWGSDSDHFPLMVEVN